MSDYPIGSVGGVPVANAFSWGPTSGVTPTMTELDVPPEGVQALTDGPPRPVTLVMGTRESKFENVFVLQAKPADAPYKGRVVVADWRWLWSRSWLTRTFNERRVVGVKRMEDPTSLVLSPLVDKFNYAPWSINGDKAWTAIDALRSVFETCLQPLATEMGFTPALLVSDKLLATLEQLPIENLSIDAPGDEAFDTIMRYLPAAACYVTATGDVQVYSMADGGDRELADQIGPPVLGQGRIGRSSLARLRPSYVDVRFSRRLEVRFNYAEPRPGTTTDVTKETDTRTLFCVMPVVDFVLPPYVQDTWITVEEGLALWGPAPFKSKSRPITTADLREAMVPFLDLAGALQQSGLSDPDVNWPARVESALANYRQTFRLPRRWMDRVLSWDTSRVGTIDFTTGTRGTSAVYTDVAYLFSMRSLFQEAAVDGKDLSYATMVVGYPADDLIASVKTRTPALLQVVDHDQGIFKIAFHADRDSVHTIAIPSQLEQVGDNTAPGHFSRRCGPCGDPALAEQRGFSFQSLYAGAAPTALCAQHKVAVILTLQPAPGIAVQRAGSLLEDAAFTTIRVLPNHVPPFAGREACYGPPMRIHVGPGVEWAKIAWSDDAADDIEGAFGIGSPPNAAKLDALTTNLAPGGAQASQGASLNNIARAVAARVWMTLADRVTGSIASRMDVGLVPAGWVPAVTHSVAQNGSMWSAVQFPDRGKEINFMHFLDTTTQRIIRKTVLQGNS